MAVDGGDHVRLMGTIAAAGQRQTCESQPKSGTTEWGGWSRAGCSQRDFWSIFASSQYSGESRSVAFLNGKATMSLIVLYALEAKML
jgi:hypothetical protein